MAKTTCAHPDRKNFSHGNCKQCAQVIYSQKRQKKLIADQQTAPKKKVKHQTELTQTLRKIYKELLAQLLPTLLPQQNTCKGFGKISGCTKKPTEVHHMKGRRGWLLILSKYFCLLCRNCHDICTEDSALAKDLGISLPINSKTEFEFTDLELSLIARHGLNPP